MALSIVFAGVVAASTVAYAVLTWRLTKETIAMREAQTDPHIAVSVEPHAGFINLIEMVIENHGPGPARNVTFQLDGDFIVDKESGTRLSETHLFRYGISYLSPRQHVRFFMGSLVEHQELLDAEPMHVRVRCEDSAGKLRTNDCYLDVRYLKGLSQLGRPDLCKIAEAAEKLASEVNRLASGSHQLHVVTQTKLDKVQEEQALRREWEEQRAQDTSTVRNGGADGQGD